jgi:hypothetical protein
MPHLRRADRWVDHAVRAAQPAVAVGVDDDRRRVGGPAGCALASALGMVVGRDTLLNLLRSQPDPEVVR